MVKKRTAMERLLSEGFFESREAALPYLMSGAVYCGAQPVTTGGQLVPGDRPMTVRGLYDRYVSKGGYKLEGAIRDFGIETQGRVCIDAGACTGRFTDCLVKHGAALVAGLAQLAVGSHSKLSSDLAWRDPVKFVPAPPKRGTIRGRDGTLHTSALPGGGTATALCWGPHKSPLKRALG